jgi:hypothetical protein
MASPTSADDQDLLPTAPDGAAVAKLPAIRDLARAAIAAHTGAPFDNPLFPLRPVAR